MTKRLLASVLWCAGLITIGPGNPRFTGTVILVFNPSCHRFGAQTSDGLVLFEYEDALCSLERATACGTAPRD